MTSEIPPVTADQFSGGVSIESNRGFLFSMEAYLKMMNGVTTIRPATSMNSGVLAFHRFVIKSIVVMFWFIIYLTDFYT